MAAQKYKVGKGRLYFNQFVSGTLAGKGEKYLGNTPGFSVSVSKTALDHYSSEGGISVKDASVDTQINRSGKMTCDNISPENVALFFTGTASTLTTVSASAVTETIAAYRDTYIQLGVSASLPQGLRKVTNVVVKIGAATIAQVGNYDVDLTLGRIYIYASPVDVTLINGASLIITYDVAASTREVVVSANTSIFGSLRYVSDNPVGDNSDMFLPYVKLSPNGEFTLKGDKWQELSFDLEVLLRDSATQAVYVDGRPV